MSLEQVLLEFRWVLIIIILILLGVEVYLARRSGIKLCNEDPIKIGNNLIYTDKNDTLNLRKGNYEIKETELMKKIIKKGDIVVDVGANIGVYTLLFAELVGDKGKVYAFEPELENFKLLEKNVEINGYKNVVLINKAVSDKTSKLKLYICKDNKASHRIYNAHTSGKFNGKYTEIESIKYTEIESIKLDDYFKDKKIDFIKIDVEGAEPSVINGGKNVLMNKNIKLVTEFYPLLIEDFGYSYKQHLKDILNLGFSVYDIENNNTEIQSDFTDKIRPDLINYTNLYCRRGNE